MPNNIYWARRKDTLMFDEMQKAEDSADEIARIYTRASDYLEEKMAGIFEKFMKKYGLTEKEAEQILRQMRNPSDMDELMKLLRNNPSGDERTELLKQLEAPAYRYRISRLKALQDEIGLILSGIAKQQEAITRRTLKEIARDGYYHELYDLHRRSGVAFPFNRLDERTINGTLKSRWSGANYSSRIWRNTDELAKELKEELILSIVTGRSDRDAARAIQLKMASGSSQARRLIRTESNFIYTQMDMKGYEEANIGEYLFLATLDLRTSAICRSLDGKIFKVSEQKPGKNCPPMHPWCRSTTIAVINREWLKDMKRKARDPATGRVIEVPMSMSYQDWYKEYVEGKQISVKKGTESRNLTRDQFERYRERGVGPETYEEFLKAKEDPEKWKQLKRDFKDVKQYEEYKKILGDDSPETLEEFQKIKYNNFELWKYIKIDYQRRYKLHINAKMALPGLDKLVIDSRKFTEYLFNVENSQGWAKGQSFISRLGYSINNWEKLQSIIREKASLFPAEFKRKTEYGEKYEQRIIVYGLKGTPANVEIGWIHKPDGSTALTSAYINEVKHDEG